MSLTQGLNSVQTTNQFPAIKSECKGEHCISKLCVEEYKTYFIYQSSTHQNKYI